MLPGISQKATILITPGRRCEGRNSYVVIIATCAFKSNELTTSISYALLAADIRVRKLHVNLHV